MALTLQQLTTKVKEISEPVFEDYPHFNPHAIRSIYDVIEKVLKNLKELLDEACKSTEIEPFTRSELERFRKHLDKATLAMEDNMTCMDCSHCTSLLLSCNAEDAVDQLKELFG